MLRSSHKFMGESTKAMHKSQAIAAICSAAENYHMNYENKQMLFLGYKPSSNHVIYVEVAFDKTNFLHLTGVKLLGTQQYNANTFYDRCLAKKLSPDDFDFAQDGTTELKLRILSYAFSGQFLNAKMMGGLQWQRNKSIHRETYRQQSCLRRI